MTSDIFEQGLSQGSPDKNVTRYTFLVGHIEGDQGDSYGDPMAGSEDSSLASVIHEQPRGMGFGLGI